MKEKTVSDIAPGDTLVDFFLVREKAMSLTRGGKPYLSLDLQDKGGRIDAKLWDNAEAANELFGKGDVVKVRALVEAYQGTPQLNVKQIRKATDDDPFEHADLLPATSRDVDAMWGELLAFVKSVTQPDLARLLASFFDDDTFCEQFRRSVAARDVHHAYIGGLLEHVLSVVQVCAFFAEHYEADRDLLITGAILHDIGKLEELDSVREFNYTVPGGMLGHIVLGVKIVAEQVTGIEDFPEELAMLLEHMILSHQGTPEWGSPVPPKTREAVLLHFADNVDAKHALASRALADAAPSDDPWTPRVRYLGHSLYRGRQQSSTLPDQA